MDIESKAHLCRTFKKEARNCIGKHVSVVFAKRTNKNSSNVIVLAKIKSNFKLYVAIIVKIIVCTRTDRHIVVGVVECMRASMFALVLLGQYHQH